MKKLLPILFTITVVHVQGTIWQIVDTDNKIVCYLNAAEKGLYGSTLMSCVALSQEPVPAKDNK